MSRLAPIVSAMAAAPSAEQRVEARRALEDQAGRLALARLLEDALEGR